MTITFNSPAAFGRYLERQVAAVPARMQRHLGTAGRMVRDEARHRIGQYQQGDGVFPTWKGLSPATQEDRAARGFSRNKPLYRSGELRRAVEYSVTPMAVAIGVRSGPGPAYDSTRDIGDIARYMEFGTLKSPPRPFLGPAFLSKWPELEAMFTAGLVGALTGGFRFAYGTEASLLGGEIGVRTALRAGFAEGKAKGGR